MLVLKEPSLQVLALHHVLKREPSGPQIEIRLSCMTVPKPGIFLLLRINEQINRLRGLPWHAFPFSLFKNRTTYFNLIHGF